MKKIIDQHTVVCVIIAMEVLSGLFLGMIDFFEVEAFFLLWAAFGLLLLIISYTGKDAKLVKDALQNAATKREAKKAKHLGGKYHGALEEEADYSGGFRMVYLDYGLFMVLNLIIYGVAVKLIYG